MVYPTKDRASQSNPHIPGFWVFCATLENRWTGYPRPEGSNPSPVSAGEMGCLLGDSGDSLFVGMRGKDRWEGQKRAPEGSCLPHGYTHLGSEDGPDAGQVVRLRLDLASRT